MISNKSRLVSRTLKGNPIALAPQKIQWLKSPLAIGYYRLKQMSLVLCLSLSAEVRAENRPAELHTISAASTLL